MNTREIMLAVLAAVTLLMVISFWRFHRDTLVQFNALDLIMENGRVSKIAFAFMVAFAVTTWLIVYLAVTGKMSEGYLTSYGAMWVAPLVLKVVFNKNDIPGTTSTSTLLQQTTEVTKP